MFITSLKKTLRNIPWSKSRQAILCRCHAACQKTLTKQVKPDKTLVFPLCLQKYNFRW